MNKLIDAFSKENITGQCRWLIIVILFIVEYSTHKNNVDLKNSYHYQVLLVNYISILGATSTIYWEDTSQTHFH